MRTDTSTGGTRTYGYDAVGNVASFIDRTGDKRTFQYDYFAGQYRPIDEKWYDGTNPTSVNDIGYSYNSLGQLTGVSDNASNYSYTYSTSTGELQAWNKSAATNSPASAMAYTYDAWGRRTSTAANIAGQIDYLENYSYDALGRLTSLTQQGQAGGRVVAPKRVVSERVPMPR